VRVQKATRENISEHLKHSFDLAVAAESKKRGRAPSTGNWTTMLYSPEACFRAHNWSEYLIHHSSVPKAIQELAMLVVAREFDCQYIWSVHVGHARKAGLSEGLVEALRDKKPLPATISVQESAVVKYGQEFYQTKKVKQATFEAISSLFGTQFVVELTMLMGFYATLAFNLNAFEIDSRIKDAEPPLPL
jgi:4-carboxymuconolactone decarboxylase